MTTNENSQGNAQERDDPTTREAQQPIGPVDSATRGCRARTSTSPCVRRLRSGPAAPSSPVALASDLRRADPERPLPPGDRAPSTLASRRCRPRAREPAGRGRVRMESAERVDGFLMASVRCIRSLCHRGLASAPALRGDRR